jgi:RsiW-degrading membrane proteinase PrsW (M82 family)
MLKRIYGLQRFAHTSLNKAVIKCYGKDGQALSRVHKPGLGEMLFFLGSGVIVSIPMALFFEPSADFLNSFLQNEFEAEILAAAVLAPIIEEFAKAYPLFYRHGESQKSLFTMGLLVGLGFGVTEFFAYVILRAVPWYVRLPGIFFHASLTSIVAYGIAAKRSAPFYLVAVFLHSSVNFTALEETALPYSLLLATAYILCFLLYSKASEQVIDY